MIVAKRTEMLDTQSFSTTTAQTLKAKIVKQSRRLAGVRLSFTVVVGTAPTAASIAGVLGLIREVRLRVNDFGQGLRNAVQIKAPALASWVRYTQNKLDRFTQDSYVGNVTSFATGTYKFQLFIPCYDIRLGEKAVNLMSIPLNTLKEDASVEVDVGTATDIGTSTVITGNVTMKVQPIYRAEPSLAFPYIPSELATTQITWTAAQKDKFEFQQDGWLTGFLCTNFTAATTRGAVLTSGGQYRLKYGDDERFVFDDDLITEEQDMCSDSYPNSAQVLLSYRNIQNEFFFDFLKDQTTGEAFGIQTAWDLRTETMLGKRAQLIFDQIGAANYITWLTTHRLMPFKPEDLNTLVAGV